MTQKIWILTAEVNDYNQQGEYFLHAFSEKPTVERLRQLDCWEFAVDFEHVANGGGRKDEEDVWYYLREENLLEGDGQ